MMMTMMMMMMMIMTLLEKRFDKFQRARAESDASGYERTREKEKWPEF